MCKRVPITLIFVLLNPFRSVPVIEFNPEFINSPQVQVIVDQNQH